MDDLSEKEVEVSKIAPFCEARIVLKKPGSRSSLALEIQFHRQKASKKVHDWDRGTWESAARKVARRP